MQGGDVWNRYESLDIWLASERWSGRDYVRVQSLRPQRLIWTQFCCVLLHFIEVFRGSQVSWGGSGVGGGVSPVQLDLLLLLETETFRNPTFSWWRTEVLLRRV